ncbi:MAG: UDP-N-acetylmuramate--L-alanine ligase [Chlamydiota bacterium]
MTTERVHFIGIGGIGMSALARIALARGLQVSGSNDKLTPVIADLQDRGAKVSVPHLEQCFGRGTKVVYSSAIVADNPEMLSAEAPIHRSDYLAELLEGYKPLAIAGTHGKTTTSSLLTAVLLEAGRDPSYAIGGILINSGFNGYHGAGDYFVVEADESDGSFIKYFTEGAIITNIATGDHLVNYASQEALDQAYKRFASQVRRQELLITCYDDKRLKDLNLPGVTYGFDYGSDYHISNYRQNGWRSCFDLSYRGRTFKDIIIPLSGRHNVLNATAVFAMSHRLEIDEDKIRVGLMNFQGAKRRCEFKGAWNNVLVLDDYAHHPNEIMQTLKGLKQANPTKELVAIFQPHRYSRMQESFGMLQTAFQAADKVVVTDIWSAGEAPLPGITPSTIMAEISSPQKHYVPRSDLVEHLRATLKGVEVAVTLGAGDITLVGEELVS